MHLTRTIHVREVPLRTRISSSRQERHVTRFYDAMPAIVQEYMDKVNEKIGTNYKLFNYYGAEDAENVIIAMGSVCETIDETIDYLMAAGEKVGVVKVRLYRPFCAEALVDAIPDTVKTAIVLDRTKEPGATWRATVP